MTMMMMGGHWHLAKAIKRTGATASATASATANVTASATASARGMS